MEQPSPIPPSAWKHASAGMTLAVTVLLFAGLGWWADQRWGWSPWGTLGGSVLGIGLGLYNFIREFLNDEPSQNSKS